MKYTFLLPAFKVKYLNDMLRSIQSQTYTDFKVLISDDCSPESIREVCDPYLTDPRFTYRRNAENMGSKSLVSHWNLLVDMCDTEYLIMASDDDVYAPDFLEAIEYLTRKYPEVDLLRARAHIIDDQSDITRVDPPYYEKASQLDFMLQYEQLCSVACVANYVWKTSSLKAMGCFVDYPLAWKSDTMTANLMARNGVANTKDVLFSFRVSGLNISSIERQPVLIHKCEAVGMKDGAMNLLFKEIENSHLNKYEKYQLALLKSKHVERTISELGMFSVAQDFSDFFRTVKHYSEQGYFVSKFQIVLLVKKWMWYHTHSHQ